MLSPQPYNECFCNNYWAITNGEDNSGFSILAFWGDYAAFIPLV